MSPELQAMHGLLTAEEYIRLSSGAPSRRGGYSLEWRQWKSQQMYAYHAKRKAKPQ